MRQHLLNLGTHSRPAFIERALEVLTCLAIGIGLAAALVSWWSS